jgi:hypothetical protein
MEVLVIRYGTTTKLNTESASEERKYNTTYNLGAAAALLPTEEN